jgi:hypothetical protein
MHGVKHMGEAAEVLAVSVPVMFRGIDQEIAPIPAETRSSKLFDDVRELFREAIASAGGKIIAG